MNAAPPHPTSPHPTDPRLTWTTPPRRPAADPAPTPLHRRDGILPAIAAALSVRGETLTSTGNKGDQPPTPHPLVQDLLDTLPTEQRDRHTGRCPETVLVSRYLTATETARDAKRATRKLATKPKPLTLHDARRALKHAKLTARHIREDGDPLHGTYAPPCPSCTTLLDHFGVRPVDPGPTHHDGNDGRPGTTDKTGRTSRTSKTGQEKPR